MFQYIKNILTRIFPSYRKAIACLGLVCIFGMCSFQLSTSFATLNGNEPFYDVSPVADITGNILIGQNLNEQELGTSDSAFNRIRDFFGMGTYAAQGQTTPALVYIKTIVNILLSLVSLISLIMIIIAFYLIFFSKQEESIGKAKKMLIGVAIALAVMGLSRYIVSYFYDIYNTATGAI